ncbi:MAG TPA: hypothetical protein VK112_02195 [Fodinibius sp.]|nr:hypothetical protein [Fodinibius sp.]
MKRFYSVILLLSFLVGTLQPILPMIEYQMHEGSVLEFFSHDKGLSGVVNTIDCFVAQNSASDHDAEHDKSLLNDNYYPLGIDTAMAAPIVVFPRIDWLYPPVDQNTEGPSFFPSPPPPRLA